MAPTGFARIHSSFLSGCLSRWSPGHGINHCHSRRDFTFATRHHYTCTNSRSDTFYNQQLPAHRITGYRHNSVDRSRRSNTPHHIPATKTRFPVVPTSAADSLTVNYTSSNGTKVPIAVKSRLLVMREHSVRKAIATINVSVRPLGVIPFRRH